MRLTIAFLFALFASSALANDADTTAALELAKAKRERAGCICGDSCACPKDKCPNSCPVVTPIPPPAPPAYSKVCDATGCKIVPNPTMFTPQFVASFSGIAAAGQFMAYRESYRSSRPGLFRGLLKRIRNR